MKYIIVIIALILLTGCVVGNYDKVIQIKGVSSSFKPRIAAVTNADQLSLDINSPYYRKAELVNASIEVASCTKGRVGALMGLLKGEKGSCKNLTCEINNLEKDNKKIHMDVVCDDNIAEKGKGYILGLKMWAELPRNSFSAAVAFPVCHTLDHEHDLCISELKVVLEKRLT